MMFAGVRMGDIEKYLTPAMQILPKYNALDVPSGYFEEAMTRLRQNFLDIAFETIIHPAPPSDTEVVDDIKEEAAAAPAPTEEQLTAEEYFGEMSMAKQAALTRPSKPTVGQLISIPITRLPMSTGVVPMGAWVTMRRR
jgi:hypothetical protein